MADDAVNDNEARIRKELSRRLKEMQVENEKKDFVRRLMEPQAYERLMNVRVANRELYSQLLDLIITLARSNKINNRLTDNELRNLLAQLTTRPEPKIEFKHK